MQDLKTNYRTEFLRTFVLVVCYIAGFISLQYVLHHFGYVNLVPEDTNICTLDGSWYKSILEHGYTHSDKTNSNTAFFCLFPWVWKATHLGNWGISIFNALLFATGFSLLTSFFDLTASDKLLWLSTPVMFFTFVPYSESLFFFLATTLIWAIAKDRKWVIFLSLILLSLTRATALFFVPSLLIMELAGNGRKDWIRSLGRYLLWYVLPILIGSVIFVVYQYQKTGVWFAYFIQQSTFWDRKFRWPVLPFSGLMGDQKLIWMSALCLFVGFVATLLMIRGAFTWIAKNKISNKPLLLSYSYLAMAMISIVCFNPDWATLTTNVIGANRYTLVNPFFFFFLYQHTKGATYDWRHYTGVIIATTLFWFLFGSYVHIQEVLYFSFCTFVVCCYMLYGNKKNTWPAAVLIALNVFFQVQLFQLYLSSILTD